MMSVYRAMKVMSLFTVPVAIIGSLSKGLYIIYLITLRKGICIGRLKNLPEAVSLWQFTMYPLKPRRKSSIGIL